MTVPSNNWPVNRAALNWLRAAKKPPNPEVSYLLQLAWWGLENGLRVPSPNSPSQPDHNDVELAVGRRLRSGPKEAAAASRWLLSNPDGENPQVQAQNLARQLGQVNNPMDAARLVVEMACERMAAVNAMSQA